MDENVDNGGWKVREPKHALVNIDHLQVQSIGASSKDITHKNSQLKISVQHAGSRLSKMSQNKLNPINDAIVDTVASIAASNASSAGEKKSILTKSFKLPNQTQFQYPSNAFGATNPKGMDQMHQNSPSPTKLMDRQSNRNLRTVTINETPTKANESIHDPNASKRKPPQQKQSNDFERFANMDISQIRDADDDDTPVDYSRKIRDLADVAQDESIQHRLTYYKTHSIHSQHVNQILEQRPVELLGKSFKIIQDQFGKRKVQLNLGQPSPKLIK